MTKTVEKKTDFSFDSIEDVHEGIQDESSAPNQPAIEASQVESVEKAKAAAGTIDKKGTVFDAKIHAVNSEGEPSLTPLGKFRKKRGQSSVSVTNKALAEQQVSVEKKAAARAAGQLAADMMVGSCVTIMGQEWIPIGESGKQEPAKFNEHENLRRAFGDYFEAKNISDFPPGIALSIAVSAYMMPRFVGGKETKTKVAKAKIWFAEKFNAIKERRKNAAQSDSRDNGVGEDDTRKKTGEPESPKAARNPST